jgi:hypothetical protein
MSRVLSMIGAWTLLGRTNDALFHKRAAIEAGFSRRDNGKRRGAAGEATDSFLSDGERNIKIMTSNE